MTEGAEGWGGPIRTLEMLLTQRAPGPGPDSPLGDSRGLPCSRWPCLVQEMCLETLPYPTTSLLQAGAGSGWLPGAQGGTWSLLRPGIKSSPDLSPKSFNRS